MTNTTGETNPSYIFSTASSTPGSYMVVQDNVATEGTGYLFLAYSTIKALAENNDISGFGATGHAISPKDGNAHFWARGNTIDSAGHALYLQGYNSRSVPIGPAIFEFNNIINGGVSINSGSQDSPVILSRNTFQNTFYVRIYDTQNGPYTFRKNVIVNADSGYTDHIWLHESGAQGRIVYDDNLTGIVADGIVDANGLLQGAYRTANLGTHGHEVN